MVSMSKPTTGSTAEKCRAEHKSVPRTVCAVAQTSVLPRSSGSTQGPLPIPPWRKSGRMLNMKNFFFGHSFGLGWASTMK